MIRIYIVNNHTKTFLKKIKLSKYESIKVPSPRSTYNLNRTLSIKWLNLKAFFTQKSLMVIKNLIPSVVSELLQFTIIINCVINILVSGLINTFILLVYLIVNKKLQNRIQKSKNSLSSWYLLFFEINIHYLLKSR